MDTDLADHARAPHVGSPVVALDHVQVCCPPGGEGEARAYWNGLLGLPEVEMPASLVARGGCWFHIGVTGLHVGVLEPFVATSMAHPALRVASVAELEALADRLAGAGYPVRWAEEPIAEARLKTRDPFGNLVELLVGTTG